MSTKTKATIEALYNLPESAKAEIVNGELILMPPTGDVPSSAAGEIFVSLHQYARNTGVGRAYADNTGFVVKLPHRDLFSPDAAFYVGPRAGGRYLEGAPLLAVEVRSENDYSPGAERAMAAKRADYFAAGTLVVWDVDALREQVVRVYRATDPENPIIYGRGDMAEAEPALPGWRMPVDDLFA